MWYGEEYDGLLRSICILNTYLDYDKNITVKTKKYFRVNREQQLLA